MNESEELTSRINYLAEQVRALDSESRKIEDGKMLKWASVARGIAVDALFLYGDLGNIYEVLPLAHSEFCSEVDDKYKKAVHGKGITAFVN